MAKMKAVKRRTVESTLQKMGKSEAVDGEWPPPPPPPPPPRRTTCSLSEPNPSSPHTPVLLLCLSPAVPDADFKDRWEYTKSLQMDLGLLGNDFDAYMRASETMAKAQLNLSSRLATFCATREGEPTSDLEMPAAKMVEASASLYEASLHTQKVFADHVLVPLEDLCGNVLPSLRTQKEERKSLLKDQSSYTRRMSTTGTANDKIKEKHQNASSKFRDQDEQLRTEMLRLKENRIELVRQAFSAHIACQADFFKQCTKVRRRYMC